MTSSCKSAVSSGQIINGSRGTTIFFRFDGCIANLEYTKSDALKMERARLKSVYRTSGNCSLEGFPNSTTEYERDDQRDGLESSGSDTSGIGT